MTKAQQAKHKKDSTLLNTTTGVKVGETMDGRAVCVGLTEHPCDSVDDLLALVSKAGERRRTAATTRNAQSSRSHGVGIIRLQHVGYEKDCGPAEGILYIIDLAGSERSSDSKEHD